MKRTILNLILTPKTLDPNPVVSSIKIWACLAMIFASPLAGADAQALAGCVQLGGFYSDFINTGTGWTSAKLSIVQEGCDRLEIGFRYASDSTSIQSVLVDGKTAYLDPLGVLPRSYVVYSYETIASAGVSGLVGRYVSFDDQRQEVKPLPGHPTINFWIAPSGEIRVRTSTEISSASPPFRKNYDFSLKRDANYPDSGPFESDVRLSSFSGRWLGRTGEGILSDFPGLGFPKCEVRIETSAEERAATIVLRKVGAKTPPEEVASAGDPSFQLPFPHLTVKRGSGSVIYRFGTRLMDGGVQWVERIEQGHTAAGKPFEKRSSCLLLEAG